jgi:hypothetical protein
VFGRPWFLKSLVFTARNWHLAGKNPPGQFWNPAVFMDEPAISTPKETVSTYHGMISSYDEIISQVAGRFVRSPNNFSKTWNRFFGPGKPLLMEQDHLFKSWNGRAASRNRCLMQANRRFMPENRSFISRNISKWTRPWTWTL